MSGRADEWRGLSYSELETAIAGQQDCTREEVRTRFRHMRLRDFPPGIRTGTGRRVSYGVASTVASSAAFELNRAGLPQSLATAIVSENWPEIAKGGLSALSRSGLAEPECGRCSSLVQVHLNGMTNPVSSHVETLDEISDPLVAAAGGPIILLDLARAVRPLVAVSEESQVERAVRAQADALTVLFGESAISIGSGRGPSIERRSGSSFLDEGPFWARAHALLTGTDHFRKGRQGRWYQQYVARPAPLDLWKRFVRFEGEISFVWAFEAWWQRSVGEWQGPTHPHTALNGVTLENLVGRLLEIVAVGQCRAR